MLQPYSHCFVIHLVHDGPLEEPKCFKNLQDLKDICELFLVSKVTVDNAIEMLALGQKYGVDELKKKAMKTIENGG